VNYTLNIPTLIAGWFFMPVYYRNTNYFTQTWS